MCVVEPVLLDTQLSIVCAQWSYNGSVLAIGGQHTDSKENSFICFYSPLGAVRLTLCCFHVFFLQLMVSLCTFSIYVH